VWRIADQGDFDHVWGFDHFAAQGGLPERQVYDSWTMRAAMAGATKRVRIGVVVTGATYRHPGVLAPPLSTTYPTAASSSGSGPAGARSSTSCSTSFPHCRGRIRRLEEQLEVIKRL
jgi:alkanesulfonate monooxygenase SsuD/methylene tetrahydromethanopterin reductase-like flavin-dependent oxidoreductase (luciferase family)